MALSAERGPHALRRNVPATPPRHPLRRLRPRLWGAGPTLALVILQAAVFAVSGCLLAPSDISHPGGPGSAWAFALPTSPVPPPPVVALPDGPSRGERVRARVALPVTTTPRTVSTEMAISSTRTPPGMPAGSDAPRQTDRIELVGYVVLPAALTPHRPRPVAGPAARHALAPRTARTSSGHRHLADHRLVRPHQHRGTLLARTSLGHKRHGSGTAPGAPHREAC
ncbi:hypothetical protein [Oryzihumus leptocrescens]|uniref:Uncharacterized protein n=1 Tax=Oryzihumus leptocrescens TaxID=297536 RepID=A0A542Z9F2_9MICO|nr:hypothetical protein [Oryzihumus leptocrescens]TQL56933.1 hypothetical protein FB474_3699 [Oryzihumus leptocrescens]